jgi:hypothetical protein
MALQVRYRTNYADPGTRLTGFIGQIRSDLTDGEVQTLLKAEAVEVWLPDAQLVDGHEQADDEWLPEA